MSDIGAAAVAAVDWGTTRLRIWLLGVDGRVLAERRGEEGLAASAEAGFGEVLERNLAAMDAPDSLPAIVCGMAGSRQGWLEVPYVPVPARLEDVLAGAVSVDHAARAVRILPGIAQVRPEAPDVMRGEETILAGLADTATARVCLPGTHSKWADLADGTVTGFSTYLSGELFSLLAENSILRHAFGGNSVPDVKPQDPVFRQWLEDTLEAPQALTARLFRIRAAGLLRGMPPADAAAALSGLVIGAELADARAGSPGGEVVLVAAGALGELYGEALRLAGFAVRPAGAEKAVRRGLLEAARANGMVAGGNATG